MNENENDVVVDKNTDEQEEVDQIDWKAEALKAQGIAKRLQTKLEKKQEEKQEEKPQKGLDRLDRAVLRVEKITAENEVKLVEDIMIETGKTLEQVLESKYFQSELKEMRNAEASKDATPSGTKRSGQSPRTEVDYWIAKGELPPMDMPELRREYVNKKMERASNTNRFTDNPVG